MQIKFLKLMIESTDWMEMEKNLSHTIQAIQMELKAGVAIKESVIRCGWDLKYLASFFNWRSAVVQ